MPRHTMIKGVLMVAVLISIARPACAGDDENRLIGNLLTGLTGPQQTTGAIADAQARDQLVSMLTGGEYVTSRQGEPVDAVVAGVPLTHRDHVYIARPVTPVPGAGGAPGTAAPTR